MDDDIRDTPDSPPVSVHPGRLAGRKDYAPVRPKHRCLGCRCALTVDPSRAAVLSMHLQHFTVCRDNYVERNDLVGIGDGGLVIVSTLHAFKKHSAQWVVRGVAPNGELLEVAKCKSKKDAEGTLMMFCVDPLRTGDLQ